MPTSTERAARRDAHRNARAESLANLEDAIVVEVEDFFDSDRPHAVKQHVGQQIKELMTSVHVHGHADPGSLLRQPIAALGSGATSTTSSPSSDELTEKLEAVGRIVGGRSASQVAELVALLFGSFDGLTPEEQNARAAAMTAVSNGSIEVKLDGTPKVNDELANVQRQLADSRDELRNLHRQVDPLLQPLESLSDTDKRDRMTHMRSIATSGAPAPTPDPRVAELEAAIRDVDDALVKPGRFGSDFRLDPDALKRRDDTTKVFPKLKA